MDVRDFAFDLPQELIAQEPASDPSTARLLVMSRTSGALHHALVADLPRFLEPGDLLVVNDTRVLPARLLGRRVPSGGRVECLLIRRVPDDDIPKPPHAECWDALMHPGQKLKPGARVEFEGAKTLHGEVLERRFFGRRVVRLWTEHGESVAAALDAIGHVPLPPYIAREDRPLDRERYQTIFARAPGSVAAPTAGLHFSAPLLAVLAARGIELARITLHVGYGTFQPVRVENVEAHRLDPEPYEITDDAAQAVNRALDAGRRVVAVGTTTTRTLEAAAQRHGGRLAPGRGETGLFIYPGFSFQVVRALLTNFHLPQSSLLMLVSAFAGREAVLAAYGEAVAARYRFYSYGDAMLIA
jgi:S-adenosylmethionine:tRNA ribosyltransferase-isomerase